MATAYERAMQNILNMAKMGTPEQKRRAEIDVAKRMDRQIKEQRLTIDRLRDDIQRAGQPVVPLVTQPVISTDFGTQSFDPAQFQSPWTRIEWPPMYGMDIIQRMETDRRHPLDEPGDEKPDIVAELMQVKDAPSAEYMKLAEEVGLDSPALLDIMLRQLLQREEILVYPAVAVTRFMGWVTRREEKARKAKGEMASSYRLQWVWRAMRIKDAKVANSSPMQTYNRPVPMEVLALVKQIEAGFAHPEKLCFEVTDYEVRKPDPFLSVRVKGSSERYIVKHWDEPFFHMDLLKS